MTLAGSNIKSVMSGEKAHFLTFETPMLVLPFQMTPSFSFRWTAAAAVLVISFFIEIVIIFITLVGRHIAVTTYTYAPFSLLAMA